LIEDLVAVGGTSVVYRADDLKLSRDVAIKVYNREQAYIAQFELLDLRRIGAYPCVPALYDWGETPYGEVIVMEFVQGSAFPGSCETQRTDWASVSDLARHLVEAVCHVHGRGVIHGDIKPSNVMVGIDQQIKLIDFGTVTLSAHSERREILGTPGFMAPEVLLGSRHTLQSDIFSLGATLYCALAGQHPFAGDTVVEILSRTASKTPPPIYAAPASVAIAVNRMLARNPEDRPRNAEAVLSMLFSQLDAPVRTRPAEPSVPFRTPHEILQGAASVLLERNGVLELWRATDQGYLRKNRWSLAREPRIALLDLFIDLFEDYRALRGYFPPIVQKYLPSAELSLVQGAHSTVEFLINRGDIGPELFQDLLRRFPRRAVEIYAVQRLWEDVW